MDPVADMLTRIRNAQAVLRPTADIPFSNLKFKLANILLEEEFIKKVEKKQSKTKKIIRVFLKYENKQPVIREIKRVSRPGKRVYLSAKKIRLSRGGQGIVIVSTSRGLMTAREAKKRNLGGEVIAEVW